MLCLRPVVGYVALLVAALAAPLAPAAVAATPDVSAQALPNDPTPTEAASAVAAEAPSWLGKTHTDAGLLMGLPAALPVGLTFGVGGSMMTGGPLAWGFRAAWSQATEYTSAWAITHSEVRLRAVGALRHGIGRGVAALRLCPGVTFLHETGIRAQSARLGTSGLALDTSAWALLPGIDLEAAVELHVVGDFGLIVSAGPSLHWLDGTTHAGWVSSMGVAWLP